MKILYLTIEIDIDMRNSNGVFKKIVGQSNGLVELGHSCDIMLIYMHKFYLLRDDKIVSEGAFSSISFEKMLCENQYDLVYARNGGINTDFKLSIEIINRHNIKCVVEIPTYPILGELMGKANERFRNKQYFLALRSFLGGIYLQYIVLPLLGKKINRFAIVSSNVQIGKTQCVRIENGIDMSKIPPISFAHRAAHPFTMIAVANVSYWHSKNSFA